MNKTALLQRITDSGVIAVMRGMDKDTVVKTALALRAGGIEVLEITADAPGVLGMIEAVNQKLAGEALVGVGTVLDPETARAAIMAGAEFIFTPTLDTDVITMANRYGRIVISGAMTPTEILTAFAAGAPMIKVFPANVLGPSYLKQVHGPLPHIPLCPTGGVGENNVKDYIAAGAVAVGAGGALVDRKAIDAGNFDVITENARRLVTAVAEARRQ